MYAMATYGSYHIYKIYTTPTPKEGISDPKQQPSFTPVYNQMGALYDDKISWDEYMLGIESMRCNLLKRSIGDVLEVSAGTGRNLKYYPKRSISTLHLTDTSPEMLKTAFIKHKREPMLPDPTFTVMNSQKLLYEDSQFDTVIDTFGLCSHTDPVAALREMQRVCRPFGRILLLEHGRGYYSWLNDILDKLAPGHAAKWGCWWNRDIRRMISEAGLRVVSEDRHHFGTTYVFVCNPNKPPPE